MSRKVYIGRLNDQVRERDVERFFKGFRVRDIMLKSGYGFVEFDNARDAEDAVYDMNGKELCGDRIIVEIARGPAARRSGRGGYGGQSKERPVWLEKYGAPVRTPYRVVVENLSSRVSWQDLKDYLRTAGEVTYADAHKETRNQGIVEFASYKDMKNVLEKLDNTEINGRRIRIISDYQRDRRQSRSRSKSRSRSNHRSRNNRPEPSRSRSPRHSASRSLSRSPKRRQSGGRDSSADRGSDD